MPGLISRCCHLYQLAGSMKLDIAEIVTYFTSLKITTVDKGEWLYRIIVRRSKKGWGSKQVTGLMLKLWVVCGVTNVGFLIYAFLAINSFKLHMKIYAPRIGWFRPIVTASFVKDTKTLKVVIRSFSISLRNMLICLEIKLLRYLPNVDNWLPKRELTVLSKFSKRSQWLSHFGVAAMSGAAINWLRRIVN